MIRIPKWKTISILAVCLLGLMFAAPNIMDRATADSLPAWLPSKQISLGLDLQGGSHLLLEVKVDVVIAERLEALVDSIRTELRKENISYSNLGSDGHTARVTIKNLDDVEKAYSLINPIDSGFVTKTSDNGLISATMSEQALSQRRISAVEQSIEIVRRRIDETGVREPTIVRQGEERILVQLPGVDDPERVKRLLGKTAKLTFHLVDQGSSFSSAQSGRVPPGTRLLPAVSSAPGQPSSYLIKKRVMVSGDTLIDATPGFDQRNNEPVVNFRFDSVGAKRFGDVTIKNVGKPFAIVLDGKVISAPVIREPILGGAGQISGNFTTEEAKDLALLLRAGALPAPLSVLEERSVGPGLGADSIASGKVASTVGLVLVIVFMALYYGRFGLMADVALIINIIMIIGSLSALQATLTLPGIAGIVLTIGMAVDANVLIFERIREEIKNGRTVISAIESGYSRAITTIIDANVTTLIAALLLYQFGSGPVRGFAVTLAVGIATSMFTAIWLTRLIVVAWLRRTRPQTLEI
ncbi:MAG: protein translocase subunit SecD [Rhodospirillaceae bacterium]|nr:protein translocase subunit SecD [Rhodospirillaceae bacterium]